MANILVTGGSGKAGPPIIRELLAGGHRVLNADLQPPAEDVCPFLRADVTDFGQAVDVIRRAPGTRQSRRPFDEAECVVHLAAIPDAGMAPDAVTFRTNVTAAYNIFSAAALLGIRRVVWASSETIFGVPFRTPPVSVPITDDHPFQPDNSYALSKVVCEETARHIHRWTPSTTILGLRFGFIRDERDYRSFRAVAGDALHRSASLWNYVDSRDAARACRLAVESAWTGAGNFLISAADTVMTVKTADLLHAAHPGVPHTQPFSSYESLFRSDRALAAFGYEPKFSWRDST
jgi:nucleoside-diphosphate-sugar epimerase